jgi:hypothetical protein
VAGMGFGGPWSLFTYFIFSTLYLNLNVLIYDGLKAKQNADVKAEN